MPTINLTQSNIQTALRSFLLSVLPSGVEVVQGQINRVPEPRGDDFVMFWVLGEERLSTNVDDFVDTQFTASIAGTLMNVVSVDTGSITPGAQVFGQNVIAGTSIVSGPSDGGPGTYVVNVSQSIAEEGMSAGTASAQQSIEVRYQLDIHGPNSTDNMRIITTLFRDDYGVQAFAASGFDVVPLYMSEPRQLPFDNGENQQEMRWSVDAHMQAIPVVQGLPQQAAVTVSATTISASKEFPG